MTTFGSNIGAAILGGLLSLPAVQAAMAAPCNAGDLAGAWSFYASLYLKPANVQPTVMFCNATLTNAGGGRYDLSGPCRNYQTSADVPINAQISANNSLVENPNTCKLTGTFRMSGSGIAAPGTIIDARIEGGAPKRHITGIARIFVGSDNWQLLDFRFQR